MGKEETEMWTRGGKERGRKRGRRKRERGKEEDKEREGNGAYPPDTNPSAIAVSAVFPAYVL